MQLAQISVKNYRSIVEAIKNDLRQISVLVGPNNEGKSNLLRAIRVAMTLVSRSPPPSSFALKRVYDYDADFPLQLQTQRSTAKTIFRLLFRLNEKEVADFKADFGINLNGDIPIDVSLGRNLSDLSIRVPKRGPKGQELNARSGEVTEFVSRRLHFEYIPAIRTAEEAQNVAGRMVALHMATLDSNKAYMQALEQIRRAQEPILEELSEEISDTLRQFLPNVESVKIRMPEELRRRSYERCQILIDDGVETDLASKGDGIQSLFAIGLMRHAAKRRSRDRNLVVAVEEPESHLHPNAQHELRSVIETLSQEHQIVITTHCPLFVNRTSGRSNLIVRNNTVAPAKSIGQIREVLGRKRGRESFSGLLRIRTEKGSGVFFGTAPDHANPRTPARRLTGRRSGGARLLAWWTAQRGCTT